MSKNLAEILNRSREIMDTVGDKAPSQVRPNKSFGEQSLYSTIGVSENIEKPTYYNEQSEGYSSMDVMAPTVQHQTNLPPEIVKSFASTPYMGKIMTQDKITGSVLDNINEEMLRPRPSVVKKPNPTPTTVVNGGIDYTIIKALIDESIKRNLQEMKTQLLTENTDRPITTRFYANNNKIQVIDGDNVYEGKVEYKGKLKKKK